MDLSTYKELFEKTQKPEGEITGLCGRILRGRKPEDFKTLTDEPERRKIIMLMAGDGLIKMLGTTGFQALKTIGYEREYIEYKLKDNYKFKLVVFAQSDLIKPATWNNVAEIVTLVYPDVKSKIYDQLDNLKSKTFKEIQDDVDISMKQTYRNGPNDPLFMTYDRFKSAEATLYNVRVFLYHTVELRDLFAGDGYTYDEEGNRGLMEYIAPNKPLDELGEHILIDLDVTL
ncbi:MAG: hypothetical protein GF364_06890 [Candidatus Lokiarchaeota archaeon]|nr:hypothetical protein [Candidatus Lokiarchaeota archaeon]